MVSGFGFNLLYQSLILAITVLMIIFNISKMVIIL